MSYLFPLPLERLAERSRVIGWIPAIGFHRVIKDARNQLVTSNSLAGGITWSAGQFNTAKLSRVAALASCRLISRNIL